MTEPQGEPTATTFLDSLGPRGRRRAEPRASIAIAGAGCALAVLGVLVVAGDTGASDGDFNKVPGIVLSAIVVAAGFFTLSAVERGAIATAGAVAAALGVPALMFFLTFDQGGFPPYSTEGILIVSTAVWLGVYAVGPARGRPFFLGAGLIGLWATVLQVVENVFDAPFGFVESSVAGFADATGGSVDELGGRGFQTPDLTTIGLLSLGFGIAYALVTRWLDGRGHHGTATPFALAALPTLLVGVVALADDLEQAGTGLLLLVIGLALACHGGTVERRATAWLGGATATVGAAVFLADMTDDATVGGMLFVAAGIGLVAVAHVLAAALSEPDEMAVTGTLVVAPAMAPPVPPSAPDPAEEDHTPWIPPASEDPPPPG